MSDFPAKVLITSNPLNHEGGIANYYRLFFEHFHSDDIVLEHMSFGSRMEHFYSFRKKVLLYPFYYLYDLLRFVWRLLVDRNIKVVQVSPSLIPVPLLRDALIVLIAKMFRRRVIVFYRGWKPKVLDSLSRTEAFKFLFNLVYSLADKNFVLASQFKEDLINLGFSNKSIIVTTTMYEPSKTFPKEMRLGKKPRILFLGRVSELKGVGELIKAGKILADSGHDFECCIVGHGDRKGIIESFQRQIKDRKLTEKIKFLGRLVDEEKFKIYANSDLFVLPSWTEGCPNSVLEALGSGLFVVSTDVGALKDVISSGENGNFVDVKDYESLAEQLIWVCRNIDQVRGRSSSIKKNAESLYSTDVIIRTFEGEYRKLIFG